MIPNRFYLSLKTLSLNFSNGSLVGQAKPFLCIPVDVFHKIRNRRQIEEVFDHVRGSDCSTVELIIAKMQLK